MEKIDVTHTAKPDPLGRRLFLDPATGRREWEVLPGEKKLIKPATVDAGIAKAAFGMSIDAEKKFEDESKPTKPAHKGRHKAHEGDK
jgi:hypothetical protein